MNFKPFFSNYCDVNAVCTNTDGSFDCTCNVGYTGDGTECIDINECKNSNMNSCDRNAECTNTDASYSCTCENGFTGDGNRCFDINECVSGSHKCAANSMCTNISG